MKGFHTEVKFCASCGELQPELLHDFGQVPLAGYFPISGEEDFRNRLPMTLLRCTTCSLIQISPIVQDSYLFSDYRYRSFFSMKNHFKQLASWLRSKGFSEETRILEIGSNDGTLLSELASLGFNPTGVDPATNIARHAVALGHKVIDGHFSEELVMNNDLYQKFDLVISCNSFAHITNIRDVAKATSQSLVDGGFFLVEVQAWDELVKRNAFDFVYHEHKYYYSVNSMENLLSQFGFKMELSDHVESHGGSFRFLFRKDSIESRKEIIQRETDKDTELNFEISIRHFYKQIHSLESKLHEIHRSGGKVVGFGASGRANMLLGYMNVQGLLDAVYDESPERIGRNMGFTKIRVEPFSSLKSDDYSHCVVLAWNFFDSIFEKWPHSGKILLRPLPVLEEFQN